LRIALFGGAFDPPHVGHFLAAGYVLATADVDRVWLMPVHHHPFGKRMAAFEHRVEMCRRMAGLFSGGVEVSRVEADVPGDGRTVDTLEYLVAKHPGYRFRLVIGSDILRDAPMWKRFDRVVELAPPILLARGGHPHPEARGPVLPEVSSTEVRARLASGEEPETLVTRPVLDYVREHGLYGNSAR
jgi:nicotinate-nucleotide adenylyltransferase